MQGAHCIHGTHPAANQHALGGASYYVVKRDEQDHLCNLIRSSAYQVELAVRHGAPSRHYDKKITIAPLVLSGEDILFTVKQVVPALRHKGMLYCLLCEVAPDAHSAFGAV